MSEWLTWQVVDSALPTGLFAHSWGLESAWQHGEVRSLEALREFVDASVLQAGYAVLPFVNAAFRSPERLEALDVVAEAFLTNAVANRASRVQGRTLIATAGRVWPSAALTALKARADTTHAHVAPLSGATFRALALPRADRAEDRVVRDGAGGPLGGRATRYRRQLRGAAHAALVRAVARSRRGGLRGALRQRSGTDRAGDRSAAVAS